MADRVKQMLSPKVPVARLKGGWFALGGQGLITAIDLDGRMLRVAQSIRRAGKPTITRFAATPLERSIGRSSLESPDVGQSISEALNRLNLKPGPIVMAVPRSLVFLRTLTLPAANTLEELASMVQFQIGKDLPFRPDEAVIDFTVLRLIPPTGSPGRNASVTADQSSDASERAQPVGAQNGTQRPQPSPADEAVRAPVSAREENIFSATANSGEAAKTEVLVAVIQKDIVEHYTRVAAATGFKLISLGLRSCAHARCLGVRQATGAPRSVALVSLRPDEVTIEIIVDQSLVFSRVASVPRSDDKSSAVNEAAARSTSELGEGPVTDAASPPSLEADFIQAVTIELVRSLHSYEGLPGNVPLEKILIIGQTRNEQALVEVVSQRLRLPCEVFVPSAAFGLNAVEKEAGAGALAALGLAFGVHDPGGLPFDFLHPKRPPTPRNWQRIKLLATAGAGAIVLLILLGIRSHVIGRRLQVKEQVQAEVIQAEKSRPLFRDMRLKAKTVRDWTAEKRNWLDHYAYLSVLLPPSQDVYITSLSTGARGVLHLSVQARSGEILAQMDKRLREAGYEVKPLAITPGVDKYGYPFRSSVELTLPDKMKINLAALRSLAHAEDDRSLELSAPAPSTTTTKTPAKPKAPDAPARRSRQIK